MHRNIVRKYFDRKKIGVGATSKRQHNGPDPEPDVWPAEGNFSAMGGASAVSFFHAVTDSADRVAKQPAKDGSIELFSFGMGAVDTATDTLIAPLTDFIHITSRALSRLTRALPLMISPAPLEYWHIKETNRVLDCSSTDKLFAILFSMPLSKAFEPMLSTPDTTHRTLYGAWQSLGRIALQNRKTKWHRP